MVTLFSFLCLMLDFSTISVLITDIDGVLTDGKLWYNASGESMKMFHVHDGMAFAMLKKKDWKLGLLSNGMASDAVQARAEKLKVDFVHTGSGNKGEILRQWKSKYNLSTEQIAYVGDDINDLEVIQEVAVFACPANAVKKVKEQAHVILEKSGGDGAVREFVDLMLDSLDD